jgi:hypothetical protein
LTRTAAPVAANEAVERKEGVWRVRPLLSALQVPEWQELAVDRRKAEVERGVKEHQPMQFGATGTTSWIAGLSA